MRDAALHCPKQSEVGAARPYRVWVAGWWLIQQGALNRFDISKKFKRKIMDHTLLWSLHEVWEDCPRDMEMVVGRK
jgi:hypothetical protein